MPLAQGDEQSEVLYLYFCAMHEVKSSENLYYYLAISYKGSILRYKLQQFQFDHSTSSWWIYGKNGMQELRWHTADHRLEHVIIPGQKPMPHDFMEKLNDEFREIHRTE